MTPLYQLYWYTCNKVCFFQEILLLVTKLNFCQIITFSLRYFWSKNKSLYCYTCSRCKEREVGRCFAAQTTEPRPTPWLLCMYFYCVYVAVRTEYFHRQIKHNNHFAAQKNVLSQKVVSKGWQVIHGLQTNASTNTNMLRNNKKITTYWHTYHKQTVFQNSWKRRETDKSLRQWQWHLDIIVYWPMTSLFGIWKSYRCSESDLWHPAFLVFPDCFEIEFVCDKVVKLSVCQYLVIFLLVVLFVNRELLANLVYLYIML